MSVGVGVRVNQHRLTAKLGTEQDFIVCDCGASECVVAHRTAENSDASVLLLSAGGDEVPNVRTALAPTYPRSERVSGFRAVPTPDATGQALPLSMGKVLSVGFRVNEMVWARGRRSDGHRVEVRRQEEIRHFRVGAELAMSLG
jgi:choline dehydrogenase